MKNLIFFFLLTPMITFCQVSKWRSNPPSSFGGSPSYRGSSPSFNSPSYRAAPTQPIRENNGVSKWRSNPPRNGGSIYHGNWNQPRYPRRYYYDWADDYFWGFNRWNNWGAPLYGWNYWQPFWYYDTWGYRQPARVYVYDNGKSDTIKGVKPNITFGIQGSTNKEFGAWGRIGNKTYFIMEYNQTVERDNSLFVPNGQIQDADFPIVGNLNHFRSVYLGIGRRIGRTGIHLMIGNMNENVKYRGKDALGYITFPNYKDNYMCLKFGAIHDFKHISVKSDIDPIVGKLTVGLGINF